MKSILYSFKCEVHIKIISSLIKNNIVIWNFCLFLWKPIPLPNTTKEALKVLRFKKKEVKFYNWIEVDITTT